jgi:D-psicose/D-tagatose/L-ribulose 3-epimerase
LPLNDAGIAELVPHVASIGFDWIELPFESAHDFDPRKASALIQAHSLV